MYSTLGWKSFDICFKILEKLRLDRPYGWDPIGKRLRPRKVKVELWWIVGNLALFLGLFCIPTFIFLEHLFDPVRSSKRNLSVVNVIMLSVMWSLFFHALTFLPMGRRHCADLCTSFNALVDLTQIVYGE